MAPASPENDPHRIRPHSEAEVTQESAETSQEQVKQHSSYLREFRDKLCASDGWGRRSCFIRLIPPGDSDNPYALIRVEKSPAYPGAVEEYDTRTTDREEAQRLQNELIEHFREVSVVVFESRVAWDDSNGETQVPLINGGLLCVADFATAILRDASGNEIVRWTGDELMEDPDEVLGAFVGAATQSTEELLKRLHRTRVVDGCWV
jgi:hypothetical protein